MILPHDARQDRAIRDEHGDKLDRGPFVDSLVRALVRVHRDEKGRTTSAEATGYVVGLTGKWGLGKSSVVNLLALKLGSMDRVIVAQFNPWLLGTGEELLTGYFNALRGAIGRSTREEVRELRDSLDRYWGALITSGKVISAVVDGGQSAGFLGGLFSRPGKAAPTAPEQERASLEAKIKALGCAVVVLIDELDRVEDDDVRAVARLVKAVGEIKGVSYLVSYDPRRVAEALGGGRSNECRDAGNSYLEKIIQHPIPLRPLFREDTKALLQAALDDQGSSLPDSPVETEQEILDRLLDVIQTPREVKRLVGAFSILEEAVRGEISAYDVLGYCWIATKAPALRDRIAENIDALVDDPGSEEVYRRLEAKMDGNSGIKITDILGEGASQHRAVLECLFPAFSEKRDAGSGDRLSKRRNLVRMLYLGNPPGMLPRESIISLWNFMSTVQFRSLFQFDEEGKLPNLLDRIEDLLPDLPEEGDAEFWINLSRVFERDSDWLTGPNPSNELSRDAAKMLARMGYRDVRQAPRVRRAIDALVNSGDLILSPWIVRNEMRTHGLARNAKPRSEGGIFEKSKLEAMLEGEFSRYRAAILSGHALKRLPNMEIFYAILNNSRWDEELRSSLSRQLKGEEAIGTFAGLLVPPGYLVELSTIEEMCDAGALHNEVTTLLANEGTFPDPWIRESVRRLHRILNGKDPHFDDDE